MVAIILISQILIQAIFQYKHSIEGLIALVVALMFCTAIAQARWCALWAKHDDLEMKLDKLKEKKSNKNNDK